MAHCTWQNLTIFTSAVIYFSFAFTLLLSDNNGVLAQHPDQVPGQVPIQQVPVQQVPVQQVPAQQVPVQQVQYQQVPQQQVHHQQVPQQQVPQQQVPQQQVLHQEVPHQQVPHQQVQHQQVPVQHVPVQQVPVQHVPVQQVPVQQVPVQQVPVHQVPGQLPVPVTAAPAITVETQTRPWYETLPAVAMDYKVHIDAGKEDCYWQYVQPGATFYVSFQVTKHTWRFIVVY